MGVFRILGQNFLYVQKLTSTLTFIFLIHVDRVLESVSKQQSWKFDCQGLFQHACHFLLFLYYLLFNLRLNCYKICESAYEGENLGLFYIQFFHFLIGSFIFFFFGFFCGEKSRRQNGGSYIYIRAYIQTQRRSNSTD